MIQYVAAHNESLKHQAAVNHSDQAKKPLQVSVELEKKKPGLTELLPLANVVSPQYHVLYSAHLVTPGAYERRATHKLLVTLGSKRTGG